MGTPALLNLKNECSFSRKIKFQPVFQSVKVIIETVHQTVDIFTKENATSSI